MVTFRRSRKIGPFRITASPRGLSLSGGVPGARVSVNSRGEVRRTLRIPGTGIYDVKKINPATPRTDQAHQPRLDETYTMPAQGGTIELPDGTRYLHIEAPRPGVSRGWMWATIILAIVVGTILIARL